LILQGRPISLSPQTASQLILPLLSGQELEKFNSRFDVDSSCRLRNLQFRINIFKDNDGISAAIRALSLSVPRVEDIGFPNDIWKDIVNKRHGLTLATGITGAGKSTTIASFIYRISQIRACRIITLEDSIEYIFGQKSSIISQRRVGRDTKSFVDGLRSMMRSAAALFLRCSWFYDVPGSPGFCCHFIGRA